ncbi:Rhodanese-like protein [Xylariaceae sp. FL0662B]|nr:Rhodanese-like protein [Xylariaceae sp. FL0662B]
MVVAAAATRPLVLRPALRASSSSSSSRSRSRLAAVRAGATATAAAGLRVSSAFFSTGSIFASGPRAGLRPWAAGIARTEGVRWSSSSESATGSKIWSFEEIQGLTTTTSSSSPTSKPRVTLIDVREPGEIAETGRIPGSVNLPITTAADSFHVAADEFEDRHGWPRPRHGDELVFYCKAGVRSRAAARLARDAGWSRVGEYPGSWLDWSARGGKVER